MGTKAVGYLRRSTKRQDQSLERQRHEIERYAKQECIEIVRWYEDDGVSGAADRERPGFQAMIRDAERGSVFELILVHELSRLARFDSFRFGGLIDRLRRVGVRVRGLSGVVKDPYSREGKLMLGLEQDREESVKLSARTLSGQRETASRGLRAGGKVPYGYARRVRKADGTIELLGRLGRAKRDKSETVELVPGDALEVEAVRRIFEWYTAGEGFRKIAQRLNAEGIPSPDAKRTTTIASEPGLWPQSTIRTLVANPAYVGDLVWNKRSMPRYHRLENGEVCELDGFDEKSFLLNPESDWIVVEDTHEPLVSREVFERAQARLTRPTRKPSNIRHEYLLSGEIACGVCGSPMTGATRVRKKTSANGKTTVYRYPGYVCSRATKAGGCKQISIPQDIVEDAVLGLLDEEVFAPECRASLVAGIRAVLEERADSTASTDRRERLKRREAELGAQTKEAARRMLTVPEEFREDAEEALRSFKAELRDVTSSLEAEGRRVETEDRGAVDELLDALLADLDSVSDSLRDPAVPLERRQHAIAQVLRKPSNGTRPIVAEFDFNAGRGWRSALRSLTVSHLSLRGATVAGEMVAGAGFEPATSGL